MRRRVILCESELPPQRTGKVKPPAKPKPGVANYYTAARDDSVDAIDATALAFVAMPQKYKLDTPSFSVAYTNTKSFDTATAELIKKIMVEMEKKTPFITGVS